MERIPNSLPGVLALLTALFLPVAGTAVAAERFELHEDAGAAHIRNVVVELNVSGKLFPSPGPDKALKLAVAARFAYGERRLGATGREAES
ncbi:MAG TPA: hypothetical protein VGM05_20755, partial [Planctomycetaceae bacterium]